MAPQWKVGVRVTDTWWPWKLGTIVKVGPAHVVIRRTTGERVTYDKAHWQFLKVVKDFS